MFTQQAKILRLLGDETKLKIVASLLAGEKCACKFVQITGRAQSTVSSHLGDLESAGILSSRRQGRNIHYRIKDERVRSLCALLDIRVKGVKG